MSDDNLTHGGARELAKRLKSYWKAHGIDAETRIVPVELGADSASKDHAPRTLFCIRSNLVINAQSSL